MAYVYPKEMRAARDLLRRRNHFMRKRAELFAHTQNTATQYNLQEPLGKIAKPHNRDGVAERFDDPIVRKSIEANMQMVAAYDEIIHSLEQDIVICAQHHDPVAYALLQTIPGVGKIIALDILYEIENIYRFPRVQDFSSYSRLVKCAKQSNGKLSGSSGKKIGNAHLRWAFSQAAQLFLKRNEQEKKYHEKLVRKHNKSKAMSILAHKLGRAVYFMLKNQKPFDMEKFLST